MYMSLLLTFGIMIASIGKYHGNLLNAVYMLNAVYNPETTMSSATYCSTTKYANEARKEL